MLGTPVTYYPKSWEGTNGFIISADLDELFIDSIESVQVVDEDGAITTSKTSTKTDLSTLNDYLESTTYPTISYAYASNMVHIFISSFSYVVTTKFVVFGYRSGIPIKSLEDELDIPESHIELFKKYAIKEAAQLRGRIVPAGILADINELENSL